MESTTVPIILAAVIVIFLGYSMIAYGAGGDLAMAGVISGIAAAFGSTARVV